MKFLDSPGGYNVPGQLGVAGKSAASAPPTATLEIWTGTLPLFEIITDWFAAGICRVCGENPIPAGKTERDALTPVPESETICGEPGTLSGKEIDAVWGPNEPGVNVTFTVPCAPTPSLPLSAGQFDPVENADAFVPASEIVLICSARLPVFVSVTDCGPLDVPRICEVNMSDGGARLTAADGGTPVPESGMLCSEPG
jgi:hypothetical protein